jgi:DNA-binding NarL/FixJ family response regulator
MNTNSSSVSEARAVDTASGATAVSLSPAVALPSPEMLHLLFKLTARESSIATRIAATGGGTNRSIAGHLGIRYETVRSHMKHIYDKTGVHCQSELAELLLNTAARKW